jgi:threonine aldolase
MLPRLSIVSEVLPVATNIVIARLEGFLRISCQEACYKRYQIRQVWSNLVRFVTHHDFGDDQLEEFEADKSE